MKPLTLATGIVALLVLSAWAAGLLRKPQARVLCQDSRRGNLSADMDIEDVTQTPAEYVSALRAALLDRFGCTIEVPLVGLFIGQQLAWYKARRTP